MSKKYDFIGDNYLMRSMTGYGKHTSVAEGKELTVEMKSVNNRYLEINFRLPKALSAYEDAARRIIKGKILRGSVDVYFNYANTSVSDKKVVVDDSLVSGYVAAAKTLSERYGIENDFKVSDAIRIPEAVKIEAQEEDEEVLERLVNEAVSGACDALCEMRDKEGATAKEDFVKLVANIETELGKIKARAGDVVAEYKVKITERIREMLSDVEIDEARLLNEVAFFADKADINEEISRLTSHLEQFRCEFEKDGQVGRKLDFISQEMNREINTMGSKANDYELTGCVLKMKNELEKIKEQIRNVE